MNQQLKKTAFWIGVTAIIFLAIFGYSIWKAFIDKGEAVFEGPAPFKVIVLHESSTELVQECESSPCRIEVKSGDKSFIIEKEGFRNDVKTAEISRGQSVRFSVKFRRQPQLLPADKIPEIEQSVYKIEADPKTGNYALISTASPTRPLVYFQNPLSSPRIFASGDHLLIVEQGLNYFSAYKVDLRDFSREKILSDLVIGSIRSGTWSPDGKYFAFSVSSSPNIFLLNPEGEISQTLIQDSAFRAAWSSENELFFFTNQIFSNLTLTAETRNFFTLGSYLPKTDTYLELLPLPDIPDSPKNLFSLSSGRELFFEAGSGKFKIILE